MPIDFTITLAEKCIAIRSLHPYIREFCRDYLSSDKPAFSVCISQEDIEFEREKSAHEDESEGRRVRRFSDEYLETLAVYRKIAVGLLDYDTLLMHGSLIAVDGVGYLFTAKSGTGKSTHTRLWRQLFGDRAVMINDDKPLLHVTPEGVTAYGTPWDGKHRLSTNTSVPLKAVCILARSETNEIHRIEKKAAFAMLCQQTYRPSDPEALMKVLKLVDRLGNTVGLYRLGCNMELEAARVAYDGINR